MKKRWVAALVLACMMMLGSIAYGSGTFQFSFPNYVSGSLRKTPYYLTKDTSSTPYVQTNNSTISTVYFLAPYDQELVMATHTRYITTAGTYYFTWNSGYGGIGTFYRLEGYPDLNNGSWNAYSVNGTWSP